MTKRQHELVRAEICRHISLARVTHGALAEEHIEVAEALRVCLAAEGRCSECRYGSGRKSAFSRQLSRRNSLLASAARSFRAR